MKGELGGVSWWLRTENHEKNTVAIVSRLGHFSAAEAKDDSIAVCPAMIVDMDRCNVKGKRK